MATDLKTFAATVKAAAAATTPAERFTRVKPWISAVMARCASLGMSEAVFKTALVQAHRAGYLSLSRCDMSQTADPTALAASETTYLIATWHLVQV